MLDDTLVQLKAGSGQTVSRAGMAGIENRHIVLFRHLINRREERQEILLRVNVFLPMGGKQDIFLRFQSQLIQNIRLLDLRQILVQHLCHGTARYIHPFLGKAALMEIFSGMLGICQVHIGNDIHDPPVRLLRQALVLAAVSRFHVEDRNMQTLRRDGGQTAVGISQDQQGVRPNLGHQLGQGRPLPRPYRPPD